MDDVYENINDYNSSRKRKILIVFEDMIADIMTNRNSKNCRKITESLWNYYRDESSNPFSSDSKSFVEKTSEDNDSLMNAKVVIPLKHLSSFWRTLNIPLINCEVELILTWSKNCVLADMTVDADADPAIVAPSGATFKITDTKLHVPVVTLSKENDTKRLEQLKLGFKEL